MSIEFCSECDEATGKAGRFDDSIYIDFNDGTMEIGPLCDECRKKYWVCEECGYGVRDEDVAYDETHVGCGGDCY